MKHLGMIVVLVVLMLLAACGGRAPAPATPVAGAPVAGATVQPQAASPTEAADAKPAVQPTTVQSAGESGSGAEDIAVTDEETALKNLKSYKATWSFEWSGKQQDGTEQTIKWHSSESYTADPPASYFQWESSNSTEPSQAGEMAFYRIGSKTYMLVYTDGKPTCTAFSSDGSQPSSSLLDRNAFGSINSGKLVGVETVNGVQAKHYKYDEQATGVKYYTKLTGDVWIAEDGGYVVRDYAEWEGHLFGMLAGASTTDVGKGSWQREVTDINQPFTITAPEGCENAAESLPIMADATETASFGPMTSYKSAGKLADVVKFYQTEMTKAGWTAEGDATTTEDFANLVFTRDNQKATVVVTRDGANVAVVITVE